MTGQVINTTGVHVMGDFQDEAGFANGDWQPNTALMLPDNQDSILFSIVVDIPAFRKYEYRFLNGDQSYETEFIPLESRVGYDFIDNRWLYVDSLSDDTTFVGAIVFGGNAPAGLTLMRFLVDMQNEDVGINPSGIHLSGNFQGWNSSQTTLYSFIPNVYEVIQYDTLGVKEYVFVNGNGIAAGSYEESLPDSCATNQHRTTLLTGDTVFPTVCFGSCAACTGTGIQENNSLPLQLFPNPCSSISRLAWGSSQDLVIRVFNAEGKTVKSIQVTQQDHLDLSREHLPSGVYNVSVQAKGQMASVIHWVIN